MPIAVEKEDAAQDTLLYGQTVFAVSIDVDFRLGDLC
jgi:hypothetical protein